MVPPPVPERRHSKVQTTPSTQPRGVAVPENEDVDLFDAECLRLINEYFFGVRIFPGQDPGHVYVGWVTTQYHLQNKVFDQSKDRKVSVCRVDDMERIIET